MNFLTLLFLYGFKWSFYQILKMQADYSFKSFFPQSEPTLAFYQEFKKDFGSDDDILLVAIQQEKSVFDSLFLQKIDALTKGFRQISYVKQAQSLTTLTVARKTPFGIVQVPFLNRLVTFIQ